MRKTDLSPGNLGFVVLRITSLRLLQKQGLEMFYKQQSSISTNNSTGQDG